MGKDIEKSLSHYLFARPSFWQGVGRIFDFGGALNSYNTSKSGRSADYKALRSDWIMVGRDLKKAIKKYEQKHPELRSRT